MYKYAEHLDPGDLFVLSPDDPIKVLSTKKFYPFDSTFDGNDLFRYWCESIVTREQFWVTFTPHDSVELR